jgi:hypothetical protein
VVKGNQPEVLAVLNDWVERAVLSPHSGSSSATAGSSEPDRPASTQAHQAGHERG